MNSVKKKMCKPIILERCSCKGAVITWLYGVCQKCGRLTKDVKGD